MTAGQTNNPALGLITEYPHPPVGPLGGLTRSPVAPCDVVSLSRVYFQDVPFGARKRGEWLNKPDILKPW